MFVVAYAKAIPVAVWLGSAHGNAPKVMDASKTFLPDVRGVTVPVNEQPPLVPVIVPFELTAMEVAAPDNDDPNQLPWMLAGLAAAL